MSHDLTSLVEVVGFLVAIMVLAHLCADEGLFEALGHRVAQLARGSAQASLILGVLASTTVTVALSLDATAVLLTPVLLAAATTSTRRASAYASVRLANSASTLLPVSNLTNLLAFSATGLTFVGFTARMLPVWVVTVAAEYLVLRWWCRHELGDPVPRDDAPPAVPPLPAAVVAAVLVALALEVRPWVAATMGALVLAVHALWHRRTSARRLIAEANLPFAALVVAWGSAVLLIGDTPVGESIGRLVPGGHSWAALVGTALLAMAVAAVVNNLPATLLLLPAAAAGGADTILALLIGVNVGANLAFTSSLANVLWWRSGGSTTTTVRDFHLLGILTTPLLVTLAASTLWLAR